MHVFELLMGFLGKSQMLYKAIQKAALFKVEKTNLSLGFCAGSGRD